MDERETSDGEHDDAEEATSIRRPDASGTPEDTLMRVPELDEPAEAAEAAETELRRPDAEEDAPAGTDASLPEIDDLVSEFAEKLPGGSTTQAFEAAPGDARPSVETRELDELDPDATGLRPALAAESDPSASDEAAPSDEEAVLDDEAMTIRAAPPPPAAAGVDGATAETDVIAPAPGSAGKRIAAEARLPGNDTSSGFELDHRIAQGGMADVFLGRDKNLETKRAIKLVKTHLLRGRDGEEFARRFRAEAETVARLRHEHIVQVQALTTIRDRPAIVMEYLEGGDMASRLGGEPFTLEEALSLMLAMADALAYAHNQGIVHRDFKPANIMFTADGTPVLTDFGIARASLEAGGTSTMTVVGTVIGTANYMAPEQALGKSVGPAADMYAFGKVLYEALTTELPPPEASRGEVEERVQVILKGFMELPSASGRPLAELIARCLDPNEDLRPSALDSKQILDEQLARLSGSVGGFARYRPVFLGLAIGATAAGAAVAAVVLLLADPAPGDMTPAQASTDTQTPAPATPSPVPAVDPRLLKADTFPEGVSIRVDGVELEGAVVRIPDAAQRLTLVAPGRLGRSVDLASGVPGPAALALPRLPEPSFREWAALFDPSHAATTLRTINGAPDAATAAAAFTDPTLRTVAELLWIEANAPTELPTRVEELRALEAAGDASTAVALYSVGQNEDTAALEQAAGEFGFAAATWANHLRREAGRPFIDYDPWFERAADAGLDTRIVEAWRD